MNYWAWVIKKVKHYGHHISKYLLQEECFMLTIRDGIINYGLITQLDDVCVSIILIAIYFIQTRHVLR